MAVDITQTGMAILSPFETLLVSFLSILPQLVAAIILLIIGYFISALVGYIVSKLLVKLGLDKKIEQAKLSDAIGHIELSGLSGTIVKWYLFIWFIIQAAAIINLENLSSLLNSFVMWLPDLILAVILLIVGLIVADIVVNKLTKTKIKSVRFVSIVTRVIILFFVLVIALKQIGLYVALAENTFLILLAGVCLAFVIAIGIGFGNALKDEAKGIIKNVKKNL